MKILKLNIFLMLLLILPLASAVEFNVKSNFSQGETFTARVSGNFAESISANDITFYRENTRVSLIPSVKKIDNDFYIYAQLFGKTPGNYSITIQNAKYYTGGQLFTNDLSKNFTITQNFSDFSIDPGFVLTDKDFFITATNLQDFPITITSKISNDSQTSSGGSGGFFDFLFGGSSTSGTTSSGSQTTLKSGEVKKINFVTSGNSSMFISSVLQKLELSTDKTSYIIPVFISTSSTNLSDLTPRINFEPNDLNLSISTNSNLTRIFYLFNKGNSNLQDINLLFSDSIKPYISVSQENISFLGKNSSKPVEIIFSSDASEKIVEGQIRAKTPDNFYAYISVTLNFIKNFRPINESSDAVSSCSNLGGLICNTDQTCDSETKIANDGVCCLTTCATPQKTSYGAYIGWGILGVIILLVIIFYIRRYQRVYVVADLLNPRKR